MDEIKQVIIVRRDLQMSPGLVAAQVAHSSVKAILKAFKEGSLPRVVYKEHCCTKVVLGVDCERNLLKLYLAAKHAGLPCATMWDREPAFTEHTLTSVAIGPDSCAAIDRITGQLSLY